MTAGLTQETYEVFLVVLGELVPKNERITIGSAGSQLSLLRFYSTISKSDHLMPDNVVLEREVPTAFQHLVKQFSPSSEARKLRKEMVSKLQGEFPPTKTRAKKRSKGTYDSDQEHDPHEHIQNIAAVVGERLVKGELQFNCTFTSKGASSSQRSA